MKFVDIVSIHIKAGNGGDGHVSFRKEKYVPKGGPSGGNGGRGGDVVLVADAHMTTLLDFRYNLAYAAKDGARGGSSRKTGHDGADLVIRVPLGTLVKNAETDQIMVDLAQKNQTCVIAKGGNGGFGNAEFKTATNQTPRNANPGLPGDEYQIVLELKLLADVGIVGLPNVGKSTLISVISAAKPKIADYQFTTLVPNLGLVRVGEGQNYTVADIPGLIEGASDGKGLGIQFLRHVERSGVLLFLIDSLSEDPKADYAILKNELKKYNPKMLKKKKVIAFSRIDALTEDQLKEIKKIRFRDKAKLLYISSVAGTGVEEVKHAMWHLLKEEEEGME